MSPQKANAARVEAGGVLENKLGQHSFRGLNFTHGKTAGQQSGARNTEAPRSWQPMFNRVALARNMAQLHPSLCVLVPRLLHRGQHPEAVARDLESLVRRANDRAHRHLAEMVPVLVNDCALRGSA